MCGELYRLGRKICIGLYPESIWIEESEGDLHINSGLCHFLRMGPACYRLPDGRSERWPVWLRVSLSDGL